MMKNKQTKILFVVFTSAVVAIAACTPAQEVASQPQIVVDAADAETVFEPVHAAVEIDADANLSEVEADGLVFMREEEKLAGDVYRFLNEKWGSTVFTNIAASEDAHVASMLSLLEAYGIVDPSPVESGKFSDPALQTLYDELTA